MELHEQWWPSRYGAEDQLGSLNEVTPAKTVQAAQLVRSGQVFALGRVLHSGVPHFAGRFWQQTLVTNAHMINPRRSPAAEHGWGRNRLNWITELVTGTLQIGTHLDGLNHLQIGDRFYNGWRAQEIVEEWGTSKLGIETVPPVVTRGVLADVARYRGVTRLEAGALISVSELEATLAAQDVRVTPGDVLLLHTGWGWLWEHDPEQFNAGQPGVGLAGAHWMVEQRLAMVGADTWSFGVVPAEDPQQPFLVPQTLNVRHGVFVMENLATEVLAGAGVYEFMFVLTHARTRGSTAAPISPAAVI